MKSGIQLTLLIGPVVPVPAPPPLIDALERVTVTSAAGSASGFQMTFVFNSRSPLNTFFLLAGGQNTTIGMPPLRVLLVLTVNGLPHVMMDGVMTNAEVQTGQQSTPGRITVTGEDLSKVMDMQDISGLPYPAMSVEARVALIVAKYAAFGMIPVVIPLLFADVPNPLESIPAQQGTDLAYIRQLAEDAGYVFYIDPGAAPGSNTAYFGPEIKIGMPQPALNVDMDAHTNVDSLDFNFDTGSGTLPIVFIQNAATRASIPIPVPALNPLQPPLGALPTPVSNISVMRDTAKLRPGEALKRGVAKASSSMNSVTATGSLDVVRYGRPLKARGLVGVRGAGIAYDGLYYVESVTSTLSRGRCMQNFSLSRNALVSLTQMVPV